MRLLLAVPLTAVALAAAAQSTERSRPPGTAPLDAPPPLAQSATTPEQQVTRRTEDGQVIEEHRIGGKVVMQRVTPKHGRPYILTDHRPDGSLTRQDNTIDGHLSVPQWVVMEF